MPWVRFYKHKLKLHQMKTTNVCLHTLMKHLRICSGKLDSTGILKGIGFFQPYKATQGDGHNVVKFVFGLTFHRQVGFLFSSAIFSL